MIQIKENGKPRSVWRALGLPDGTNKSKVNRAYREVVDQFETEYAEGLASKNHPSADIPVFEFMCAFLKKAQPNILLNTYKSYHNMIYGKIQRYFNCRPNITVANLKPKDIEDFYAQLFAGKYGNSLPLRPPQSLQPSL